MRYEWFIERVPSNELGRKLGPLDRWKQLQADGWDVTALIAPDSKTVIAFGLNRQLTLM